MKKELVFWNVDTQHDFMDKNGALYVSDAEDIKPNLKILTEYAKKKKIKIMGSVDAHTEKYPEMKANGEPFPFHCLRGTFGQLQIKETEPDWPAYVANMKYGKQWIKLFAEHFGDVYFEKQHYDVFTNPNTAKVLKKRKVKAAVVYGVATDYCVKAAAIGLKNLGIEVYLVEDAIKSVTKEGGKEALQIMYKKGVQPTTTEKILKGKL